MRTVTYYIAEDGEQFETEAECIEHENLIKVCVEEKDVIFFNIDCIPISCSSYEDMDDFLNEVWYINCKSIDGAKFLHNLNQYGGWELPYKYKEDINDNNITLGVWEFDSNCDIWINFSEKVKDINKRAEILKQF